ncbi:MAG: RNA methyltransferase [Lachnospiraceae bacterium]|nr:RNA methyltransferase [Lachnospiraceae bacterium]
MQNIIKIEDFHHKELDIYARLSENGLYHYNEPAPGIFIAESPKVITRALDAGYEPISFLCEDIMVPECAALSEDPLASETSALPVENGPQGETAKLLARCPQVPVYVASKEVLTNLTGFQLTRGLLCAMKRRTLPSVSDICAGARRIAILENVVNPTNVGAIFRSAAALHMDAVLLTNGCSDPLYRRAARVSMGTVFQIPWTFFPKGEASWPAQGLNQLKDLGFKSVAMALSDDAYSIDDQKIMAEPKLAIILGTEGDGLSSETIADCDYTVCIPMSHGVDSLNVAAASAVAFWQLTR